MIETRCLKNVVIFVQAILSFVLSRKISPFHAVQISDNSGAFSVSPNITPEKSLHGGVMMGHWPNFIPNYGVMMSLGTMAEV